MSIQSDIPGLVGHWRTTTAGYNADSTRLTDFSGFGNHLKKLAGTPDFTQTKSSRTGFKMHGDCYFGTDSSATNTLQLPPCFTWIAVLHPSLNVGESFYPLYATQRAYPATNDPSWVAPTGAFGDNLGTAMLLRLLGTTATFGDLTFKSVAQTFTVNQWRVFTMVMQPAGGFRKIQVDAGTSVVAGAPTQQRHMLFNDELRLGYFPAGTITTGGGESMTSLQHMLYADDLMTTNPTALASLQASLIANPEA